MVPLIHVVIAKVCDVEPRVAYIVKSFHHAKTLAAPLKCLEAILKCSTQCKKFPKSGDPKKFGKELMINKN